MPKEEAKRMPWTAANDLAQRQVVWETASTSVQGVRKVSGQRRVSRVSRTPIFAAATTAFHSLLVLGFVAMVLVPWSRFLGESMDLGATLLTPSWKHPLGTDNLGRDLLVRIAGACRDAVLPLWFASATGTLVGIGVSLPLLVAKENLARGWSILNKLVAILSVAITCLPVGVVVFCFAAVYGMTSLVGVGVVMGCIFMARAMQTLNNLYEQSRYLGYWTAHESLGGSPWVRVWQYGVCGEWRSSLSFMLVFHMKVMIALEAGLSYLGFGVPEPSPSLGNILASHFDLLLKGNLTVPAVALLFLFGIAKVPASILHLSKR